MCHTNEEPAPWIALDFGKTVVIKRVEIFNRVKGPWCRQGCARKLFHIATHLALIPVNVVASFVADSPTKSVQVYVH